MGYLPVAAGVVCEYACSVLDCVCVCVFKCMCACLCLTLCGVRSAWLNGVPSRRPGCM